MEAERRIWGGDRCQRRTAVSPRFVLSPLERKARSAGPVASDQKIFILFTLCLVVDAGETDGLSIVVLYLFLVFVDLWFILKSLITLVSDNGWVRNRGIGKICYPHFTGKETEAEDRATSLGSRRWAEDS